MDELDCFLGISAGQGAEVSWLLDNLVIAQQGRFPPFRIGIKAGGSVRRNPRGWLHVVRPAQAKEGIEPVGSGQELREMAKMPFSNAHRRITLRFKGARNCNLLGEQSPFILRGNDAPLFAASHPGADRQAPGQQSGAAGSANASGHIEISKAQTFGRHLIQVGSANRRVPKTAEITITQIIGEDEDDVRWFRSGFRA